MPDLGRFLLTFDFELGWGSLESGRWRRRQANGVYRRLRERLPVLLREMDALEIPGTWATVGGMLQPRGQHDMDHLPEELARTTRDALREAEESTFDGRDLFELVRRTRVRHAIASHTYAHPRFSRMDVTADVVRGDLERFRAAIPADVVGVDRLVFPQNAERHHEVIAAMGYRVVRGADEPRGDGLSGVVAMALHPPPMAVTHQESTGLSRMVGSLCFTPGLGKAYKVPVMAVQALRGLRRAIASGGTLHVWLHPFNLAESPGLLRSLLYVLRRVATHRDRGRLAVGVM